MTTPPGWYPNPSNPSERLWWDGSAWMPPTGTTNPSESEPSVPQAATAHMPVIASEYSALPQAGKQDPKRAHGSWWKSWWAVGVLGLIIGLIIGGSAAAGAKSKPKTRTISGPTVYVTSTTTATATEQVTTTPTQVVSTQMITASVTYTPAPVDQFGDGTYQVGVDIPPGQYKTPGPGTTGNQCYYAILNSSNTEDIADNDNFDGPSVVTLRAGKYFQVDGGCQWAKTG